MNSEVNKREVGKRIKAIRTSKGMTLELFGQIFDPVASKSIVSRWESGKSIPSNKRIKTISDKFGVSTMYLLYGDKTAFDYPQSQYLEMLKDYEINPEKVSSIQKNTNIEIINNFNNSMILQDLDDSSLDALASIMDLISDNNSEYKERYFHSIWSLSVNFSNLFNNEDKKFDYKKNIFDTIMAFNYLIFNSLDLSNKQFASLNKVNNLNNISLNESSDLNSEQEELMKKLLSNLPMGNISDLL